MSLESMPNIDRECLQGIDPERLLTRGCNNYLVDRHSERKESVGAFRKRIDERAL
ncbi:hypothetical protein [Haliea sp. E17]|uniref:hypothetical protein n=1 Tax=Haliea sp. E17 TaxID=3401576 RepID=UPI003AAA2B6D